MNPKALVGLGTLWDEFVEERRGTLSKKMCDVTLRGYGNRFVHSFGSLDRITEASVKAYGLARMKQVIRDTVTKERGYLHQFLVWCRDKGALERLPEWPDPPKGEGTRSGPQRAEGEAVIVTREEALAIIELLPAMSKKREGASWPIRDRYRFAYETGLRPSTVEKIETPKHWHPGAKVLSSLQPIDKSDLNWDQVLTSEAIRILKAHAPKAGGLIFGKHDFRDHIKRAAMEVLGEERGQLVASRFSQYDFRHSRLSNMLDAGVPRRAVSAFARHTNASTLDRYTKPQERDQKEAIRVAG